MDNQKINSNDDIVTGESITQILFHGDERLTPVDNNAALITIDY